MVMVESGFSALDEKIKGFEGGKLYVFAGFKLRNVSAIGCNLAYKIGIENRHKILFFSFAKSRKDIENRLVSLVSNVALKKIEEGNVSDLHACDLDVLNSSKLIVEDTDVFDLESVSSRIRRECVENNVEIVILDGFQVEDKAQRTNAVQTLKSLSQELQIPILLVTTYKQNVSSFNIEALQWNKQSLECVDCLMYVKQPKRSEFEIPVTITFLPPFMSDRYEIYIVKNNGYECGNVSMLFDYDTERIGWWK